MNYDLSENDCPVAAGKVCSKLVDVLVMIIVSAYALWTLVPTENII